MSERKMNESATTFDERAGAVTLETHDLRKSYEGPDGRLEVLRGIDLQLHHGEFLTVMGLSGVGKSTLLNVLGLMDTATTGEIVYHLADGRSAKVSQLTPKEKASLRNHAIGFVFQFFHLLPDLTVLENLLLPAQIERTKREYRAVQKDFEERALDLLERVGIADRRKHRPQQLSGGERQRCAIARALIQRPSVLLCDEPTGNLDMRTSESIHDLFGELNRDLGTSILAVTHDPSLAARAHRRLDMIDGRFLDPAEHTPPAPLPASTPID